MPAPIIYAHTPFGFNTIKLDSLTIYTGKLRFKDIQYTPPRPYINVQYHGRYCIVSFEVIDRLLALELYKVIGTLAKEIAQYKLNEKWKWLNQ